MSIGDPSFTPRHAIPGSRTLLHRRQHASLQNLQDTRLVCHVIILLFTPHYLPQNPSTLVSFISLIPLFLPSRPTRLGFHPRALPDLPFLDDMNVKMPCYTPQRIGTTGSLTLSSDIDEVKSARMTHWPSAHDGTGFRCAFFYRNRECNDGEVDGVKQRLESLTRRYAEEEGMGCMSGEELQSAKSVGFSVRGEDCGGGGVAGE